ncbi:hypothetical protein FB451DRAFT_1127328 [Mycena latifolia]|nr:hypothetical protein FB451DRAFT_1127328 [Mycena latifolia]
MSEIFWFCLPSRPGPLTREAPLLLGNICKEWRNVALSTPQLWKYIHLDEPRSEGICLLLETWLTRGRGCPLSSSSAVFHVSKRWILRARVSSSPPNPSPFSPRPRNLRA